MSDPCQATIAALPAPSTVDEAADLFLAADTVYGRWSARDLEEALDSLAADEEWRRPRLSAALARRRGLIAAEKRFGYAPISERAARKRLEARAS